jgi:hypothetical protein
MRSAGLSGDDRLEWERCFFRGDLGTETRVSEVVHRIHQMQIRIFSRTPFKDHLDGWGDFEWNRQGWLGWHIRSSTRLVIVELCATQDPGLRLMSSENLCTCVWFCCWISAKNAFFNQCDSFIIWIARLFPQRKPCDCPKPYVQHWRYLAMSCVHRDCVFGEAIDNGSVRRINNEFERWVICWISPLRHVRSGDWNLCEW